ncbi:serine/threonine-protein kinase atr-like [Ornithodoros turicata]|uniref:serine/threonine-protein kinase atr-like n=1 Tax=Ornithodoros turicata TaxID=34597 RepID=UPI00313885F0
MGDSFAALTALRELERHSGQVAEHEEESAVRYRAMLNNILDSLLVAKGQRQPHVLEQGLECVHHCMSSLPFLWASASNSRAASAFADRCLDRFLEATDLGPPVVKALEMLLDLMRRRDPRRLRQWLPRLVTSDRVPAHLLHEGICGAFGGFGLRKRRWNHLRTTSEEYCPTTQRARLTEALNQGDDATAFRIYKNLFVEPLLLHDVDALRNAETVLRVVRKCVEEIALNHPENLNRLECCLRLLLYTVTVPRVHSETVQELLQSQAGSWAASLTALWGLFTLCLCTATQDQAAENLLPVMALMLQLHDVWATQIPEDTTRVITPLLTHWQRMFGCRPSGAEIPQGRLLCSCLVSLTLLLPSTLPSDSTRESLTSVLKAALLDSDIGTVQHCALECMVLRLSPRTPQLLLLPFLDRMHDYQNDALACKATQSVAELCCALAHSKDIISNSPHYWCWDDASQLPSCHTRCSSCEGDVRLELPDGPDRMAVTSCVRRLSSFLKFPKAKTAIASCLERVFAHLRVDEALLEQLVLPLLCDSDSRVRRLAGKALHFLEATNTPAQMRLLGALRRALAEASGDTHLRDTLLGAVGSLAMGSHEEETQKEWHEERLLFAVLCLLEHALDPVPYVAHVAREQLQDLADNLKCTPFDLVRRFRLPVSKLLLEHMRKAALEGASFSAGDFLEPLIRAVRCTDVRSLLLGLLRFLLPLLALQADAGASRLLRALARELQSRRRDLLLSNFRHVFSYLVRHASGEELAKALAFVEAETDLGLGSVLRFDFQRIQNELLLHLSSHRTRVIEGLTVLAREDGCSSNSGSLSPQNLANFLQPRLLGFLTFFDVQLLSSSVSDSDKLQALHSLASLLQLLGASHVTAVRMKVLASLKLALRFEEREFLRAASCAWNAFVHNVELSSLGPLLGQVVATLLPLLAKDTEGTRQILHFLLVENREALHEHFRDLYFVMDLPELEPLQSMLKEFDTQPTGDADLTAVLSHGSRGVAHESPDVRLLALRQLKTTLSERQSELFVHLLTREALEPIVSTLVLRLLDGCRQVDDSRLQLLAAECFGELGAIDPGRLELKTLSSTDAITSGPESEDFAFELLQRLSRSYLSAENSRVQDCSSYAIQEVLKVYRCSDSSSASGQSLWNRLPPEVQEIFGPMLHSRYIVSSSFPEGFPHPLFGSEYGSTFRDWVANWTLDLMHQIGEGQLLQVLKACVPVLKGDSNVALFLLPQVLACGVLSDPACRDRVQLEVLTVLRQCQEAGWQTTGLLPHMAAQTVFSLLQHLAHSTAKGGEATDSAATPLDVPEDLLAQAAFNCQAHPRALMHLEAFLRNKTKEQLQEHLPFLQRIYVALDEPDGIAGVAAARCGRPSLDDQIVEHQAMGRLQEAFACYEQAVRLEPEKVTHQAGLVRCLLALDQPATALTHASGLLAHRSEWKSHLEEFCAEAAWRLCSWDRLQEFVGQDPQEPTSSWGAATGRILLAARHMDKVDFSKALRAARTFQVAPLAAAALEQEAYQRGYQHLLRLHVLTELEKGFDLLEELHDLGKQGQQDQQLDALAGTLRVWEARATLVQRSPPGSFLEPLLNVRRALLNIAADQHPPLAPRLATELARCWLHSAKLARRSGHLQRAYSHLLEAESCSDLPEVFLEKAKWCWARGDREKAINELQKGIERHFKTTSEQNGGLQMACAKARLLLARYSEEASSAESAQLAQLYKAASQACPSWEDGFFQLAKYCDSVLTLHEKAEKKADVMVHVVRHYGNSLRFGSQHVYHSMPRLLSLWFDLGSQVADLQNQRRRPPVLDALSQYLTHLTDRIIAPLVQQLPPYLFFTALSQLVSRICHSHEQVATQLKAIVALLLSTYPKRAVWMMVAVSKSSYPMRVQRCQEVFQLARQQNASLSKFLQDTMQLCDRLLELCNRPCPQGGSITISQGAGSRSLHRLLDDSNFSEVLLPLQTSLLVTLPAARAPSPRDHDPFPRAPVYIRGFEDKVEVLSSLQRPKKVLVKGSDGHSYAMMLKPKDDLRKDCRLMEFNNLMNRYLRQNAEGRRRQLHIRTYSVVPLNEECGLIEWIPNLQGFRNILLKIYRAKKLMTTGRQIKEMMPKLTTPLEEKLNIFRNQFLPRFPPVFVEWFQTTFQDPTAWYTARRSYARTLAVMSVVGFILGLGDRHGENILLDASCGDVVHVDFNCLFNKGETFDWPEKVPFRLTPNMVDALGPLGYEGPFRRTCEVALRIMRDQQDALLSALKPFIHDPLVEWSKPSRGARTSSDTTGEMHNEKAVAHVNGIEQRLKGVYRGRNKAAGPPLSVEGQVDCLIHEATNEVNLCQMYVGWGAYM